MRESQLEITSVIPADSGLYTCNVSNPAGVAVSMTRVAVNMTRVTVSSKAESYYLSVYVHVHLYKVIILTVLIQWN